MAERVQGTFPDDYEWAGPGIGMDLYLRDGELDANRALLEATDRLRDLLAAVMQAATTPGMAMPAFGDCEDAIETYEDLKGKVRS